MRGWLLRLVSGTGLCAVIACYRSPAVATDADAPDAPNEEVVRPLGSVTLVGACTPEVEAPLDATCVEVTVQCPNVPDLNARLTRVPGRTNTHRGLVVLGSGGGGVGSYGFEIINRLADLGFSTVERRWVTSWLDSEHGMLSAACRYATLITWLEEPAGDAPFCVTGNSGGASEIAYALAHFGRDEIIDLAVPTAGPPMGQMHLSCGNPASWQPSCDELFSPDICAAGPRECGYDDSAMSRIDAAFAGSPCASYDAQSEGLLAGESVVAPSGRYDYPSTLVYFLFGAQDCSSAVPQGYLYYDVIASKKEAATVDAGHAVPASLEGMSAIADVIDLNCF